MCAIGRFILFHLPISQTCEADARTNGMDGFAPKIAPGPKASVRSRLSALLPSPRALSVALWSAADGEIFNPYPTRTDFNCIPCRTPLETRRSPMSVQPLLFPKSMSSSLHKSAALALHNSLGRTTKRSLESPPPLPSLPPPIKRIYLFLSPEYEKRTNVGN